MKEWNGKTVKKWHSAMDMNGNKVGKIFYEDGTTEIVRGGQAVLLPWTSDKFYKSLSGLYGSRYKGRGNKMTYYVYREELTSYYHPEEGGYYQEGGHIVEIAECQTFKKALLKIRKWLKKEEHAEDERYFQGHSWIANNKQSYGVTGKYIGQGYECGISRRKPIDRGFEPYC